jgi:hypothetical protein
MLRALQTVFGVSTRLKIMCENHSKNGIYALKVVLPLEIYESKNFEIEIAAKDEAEQRKNPTISSLIFLYAEEINKVKENERIKVWYANQYQPVSQILATAEYKKFADERKEFYKTLSIFFGLIILFILLLILLKN